MHLISKLIQDECGKRGYNARIYNKKEDGIDCLIVYLERKQSANEFSMKLATLGDLNKLLTIIN